MAHSAQAKKRIRQNEKRRLQNKSVKSEIKTLTKKLQAFVASSEKASAEALMPQLVSKLDKAGRRRVYHPNTVARKKSQLAKLLNSVAS